jgi:hypothetical protein
MDAMHDGGAEDDLISRDAGSNLGPESDRIDRVQDDSRNTQPSEILDGGPETITRRMAPPITLKAFLERPPTVEGTAIRRVFEALDRVMEQSIDVEAEERRSP